MNNKFKRTILLVDPRFPGGTSSAVAREIHALAPVCNLSVVGLQTGMFKGDKVHPSIVDACTETGTPFTWAGKFVTADIVVFHNPVCVKFDTSLPTRILSDRLFVVCHENFLRPTAGCGGEFGPESFAVSHCLDIISDATLCRDKRLAPISPVNRQSILTWIDKNDARAWDIEATDWSNICDFDHLAPTDTPRDRRGRHSRAGFEKFAPIETLKKVYPPHAELVRLLGADALIGHPDTPDDWELLPFMSEKVDAFLRSIDFFIYYTNPILRESFGRVLAEAMAAGKVVITDPGTASTFGDGVIGIDPDDVNETISYLLADPAAYKAQALAGQSALSRFSTQSFQTAFGARLDMPVHTSQLTADSLHALL